jgi:hypothetical protein
MVYFPDGDVLKELENWAKKENRSISNLAATILTRAVQEKNVQQTEEGTP